MTAASAPCTARRRGLDAVAAGSSLAAEGPRERRAIARKRRRLPSHRIVASRRAAGGIARGRQGLWRDTRAARARSAIATASYVVWVRGLFGLLVLGGLVALDGRERERGG